MITRGFGTALITRGYGGGVVGAVVAEIIRLSSFISRTVRLKSRLS